VQLVVVMLLWALCYPLIDTGLAFAPPLHFAAVRALVAGVVLLAVALARRERLPRDRGIWIQLAGAGLGGTAVGFAGMFVGGGLVTPGLASVLANAQPLLAAILGFFVLRERLLGRVGFALGLGFGGIVVIAGPGLLAGSSNSTPVGIGFVLLAACGVAVSNVLLKRLAGRVPPVFGVACQLLVGAFALAVAARIVEPSERITWNLPFVVTLVTLAVLGTAVAFVLWFSLLRRAELNRLNTYTFLTPVFGLLIAALFYEERLSPLEWSGASLVILAVVVSSRATGSPGPERTDRGQRRV